MNRKRIWASLMIVALIFTLFDPASVHAQAKSVEIRIEGSTVAYNSQKPQIINGVVMSPYVPVLKKMSTTYEWNSKKQTLTIKKDKTKLLLTIGSEKATLNGKTITLAAAPQLIKGNIYIPVESIALSLGADLDKANSATATTLWIAVSDPGKMKLAIGRDDYNKVKKLIDKGVDLSYTDKDKSNYLHLAATSSIEINRLLLEKGVSANQLDKWDSTPLSTAILLSREDLVKLLAPYTDLSYVNPYTKFGYLDDARDQVEMMKGLNMPEQLQQAENILSYLAQITGTDLSGQSGNLPAKVGQTVTIETTNGNGSVSKIKVGLTVEQVLKGQQAWAKIVEASHLNSGPAAGKEYLAVLVKADFANQIQSNKAVDDTDFVLLNPKGERIFPVYIPAAPQPYFQYYLGNKTETSGWIVFSVPQDMPLDSLTLGYKWEKSKTQASFQLQETSVTESQVDLGQLQLPAAISPTPDESELKSILQQNFGTLHTTYKGDMNFDFEIRHNDTIMWPYDYQIHTRFDFASYYEIKYGNSISEEQRALTLQEMRDHQEKIGRTLAALYPSMKFTGSYYDFWYKYPYLKVGYESITLDEWANYDEGFTTTNAYSNTVPSFFRWRN
ncbi:stalk domain-containing protein [Saccharibacillus sp. CPCC 101409]|uniref:stalk domain-containing protein n=1 Tax=Saccharibacillus sp. CPCC 101409 TaxID=3058041 RepID=UPI002673F6E7|nr:stalk domain-containing protein [Saccharibacillus sp. CPCC 101409]MDO3409894.1 stalk domain-containing protein [Saccharibacillus sp. CPCC 101409]